MLLRRWPELSFVKWVVPLLLCMTMVGGNPVYAKTTISIVTGWGGAEAAAFEPVMQAFMQQNPDIAIEVRTLPSGVDYIAWIRQQILLGTGPDLFMNTRLGVMADLADEQLIVPIDALWREWEAAGWFTATWKNLATYKGRIWGLPVRTQAKGLLWYTKAELRDLGFPDPPRTWAGWIKLLETAKARGKTPIMVGARDAWVLTEWFEALLLRVAGPELFQGLATHSVKWTDPRVVETFEVFGELIQKYFPPDALARNMIEAAHARIDGLGVIQLQGGWINAITRDYGKDWKPGVDYDFFVMPKYRQDLPFSQVAAPYVLHVTKGLRVDAAMRFVRFLAAPEAQSIWARSGAYIGTNSKVPASAYPDPVAAREARVLTQEADVVVMDLDDQMPSEMQQVFWEKLQEFVLRPERAEQVASALEQEARRIYGR